MKTSLIVLGVIFLVLGGILYLYPSQSFSAQTNVAPTGENNPVNSSARFQIPVEWSYALLIIGGLLLFFSLVIPSPELASVVPIISPVPVVSGVPGPRGPRGTKGSKGLKGVKGTKGKTQHKTVLVSPVVIRNSRKKAPRGTSVTTITTRT